MSTDKRPNFERALDRLSDRNWAQIRTLWVPHLPTITPPGGAPAISIGMLPALLPIAKKVPNDSELRDRVDGLSTAIFREGVFLLHKSSRVLAGAQIHIKNGLPSWSLTSGYHGALYAANALLRFLGVSAFQVENRSILIDVWPGPQKGMKQQLRDRYQRGLETQFVTATYGQLDQHQWWEIFQAIINSANVALWDQAIIEALLALDSRAFGRQRNGLIYRPEYWPFGDLFESQEIDGFGIRKAGRFNQDDISLQKDDFSLVIGFVLLRFAVTLIEDIMQLSPVLGNETKLLQKCLAADSHSIFSKTAA
jgi:hypothetical protein